LTRSLWRKRVWSGRSKGISTVLGTVFLTLVVFAISTNVLIWTLSQNAQYTQAVKSENQKDIDRLSENVIASGANYSVLDEEVYVRVTVRNAGSVAVQIINLWVFDTHESNQRYTNKSLDLSLNPGEVLYLIGGSSLTVTILGANASHQFVSWFVTARGNPIPLESEKSVIIAELAQGIGSISMDFPLFRYYEVQPGNILGPPQYSFNIPAGKDTVFGCLLTNLDETTRDINLTHHSCFWLSVPAKNAMASWDIAKVVNNTLVPFDFQILEWGRPTLVFFGQGKAPALAGHPAAANILLYGTIGSDDYGQNIPFISVYLSS
jgi:hypothetical protein